ncbi:DNA polymerase III subunit delta [Petralouisia muris]|jgi:DNA polymerase-3 subunit delta|uniref:DNA polymerase III subunit delta n=1 Tax=Petralouisia muris TaxID=3032872 RepID=A0AC61S111_9FIRM|nr:DNA polymerase III subunit delta [Petralouisia muris]TGY98152.1 DNA polymerase III subunit delta [Petralouisia muris]
MKSIDEDIKKGSFQPAYLLYGDESYLKRQYKQKLQQALSPSGDTMNVAYYEGKGCNLGEIIDLAETLPFLADYRLILIENSGCFKGACEELAEYMKHVAETTVFVFVEEEVDKRSKLYKAVKGAGRAVEFARQKEGLLIQWILTRLKRENKKITQPVMHLFLEKTGNDMENIDRELEKLFCYTLEKEVISAEDVEAVCTGQATGRIFEMVNCIAEGKRRQALELYYDLLALKEPPMRILFLIARQFQILLQVKELGAQGYDHKFISSKAGIPEFTVRRNLSQAGRFTPEQLKQAVLRCVQAEEDVKRGNLNDRMAVELLIVESTKGI